MTSGKAMVQTIVLSIQKRAVNASEGLAPGMNLFNTVTFDTLLACLFPLAIAVVCYRFCLPFTWSEFFALLRPPRTSAPSHFSLERAYSSYMRYATLSGKELRTVRESYGLLKRSHKQLASRIGYPDKLDKLQLTIAHNAAVTDKIAKLAIREFDRLPQQPSMDANLADLGRVREAMKHFVRDWSVEGNKEREKIFSPILNVLKRTKDRHKKTVLVPGCGLGRLAWEISELEFKTTANELSFFMTLALRFLLSPKTTTAVNQHSLHPFSHWFSHQRHNANLFRSISFPDVVPRLSRQFSLIEQDFMLLKKPAAYADNESMKFWEANPPKYESGYDYVVTLFFIDTSMNVFATMEQIYHLLKPKGKWINLGPLLWPGGGQSKVELSLNEVLQAAEEIGFVFSEDSDPIECRKSVPCEYTGDRKAMMNFIYKAEFWVAMRPNKEKGRGRGPAA